MTGDETYRSTYPKVKWQSIEPGEPLPFEDRSFDIAYSNVVLEHVGGAEHRRRFLLESLRVARAVFMTVPNRWFRSGITPEFRCFTSSGIVSSHFFGNKVRLLDQIEKPGIP
jgi:SAM-dependent methyltransferase